MVHSAFSSRLHSPRFNGKKASPFRRRLGSSYFVF
jgi:hypothetical protein